MWGCRFVARDAAACEDVHSDTDILHPALLDCLYGLLMGALLVTAPPPHTSLWTNNRPEIEAAFCFIFVHGAPRARLVLAPVKGRVSLSFGEPFFSRVRLSVFFHKG